MSQISVTPQNVSDVLVSVSLIAADAAAARDLLVSAMRARSESKRVGVPVQVGTNQAGQPMMMLSSELAAKQADEASRAMVQSIAQTLSSAESLRSIVVKEPLKIAE